MFSSARGGGDNDDDDEQDDIYDSEEEEAEGEKDEHHRHPKIKTDHLQAQLRSLLKSDLATWTAAESMWIDRVIESHGYRLHTVPIDMFSLKAEELLATEGARKRVATLAHLIQDVHTLLEQDCLFVSQMTEAMCLRLVWVRNAIADLHKDGDDDSRTEHTSDVKRFAQTKQRAVQQISSVLSSESKALETSLYQQVEKIVEPVVDHLLDMISALHAEERLMCMRQVVDKDTLISRCVYNMHQTLTLIKDIVATMRYNDRSLRTVYEEGIIASQMIAAHMKTLGHRTSANMMVVLRTFSMEAADALRHISEYCEARGEVMTTICATVLGKRHHSKATTRVVRDRDADEWPAMSFHTIQKLASIQSVSLAEFLLTSTERPDVLVEDAKFCANLKDFVTTMPPEQNVILFLLWKEMASAFVQRHHVWYQNERLQIAPILWRRIFAKAKVLNTVLRLATEDATSSMQSLREHTASRRQHARSSLHRTGKTCRVYVDKRHKYVTKTLLKVGVEEFFTTLIRIADTKAQVFQLDKHDIHFQADIVEVLKKINKHSDERTQLFQEWRKTVSQCAKFHAKSQVQVFGLTARQWHHLVGLVHAHAEARRTQILIS